MTYHPALPFSCPACGLGTRVDSYHTPSKWHRRLRYCEQGHRFMTRQQPGDSEVFDCWTVPGMNRNSTEYRDMERRWRSYRDLAAVWVEFGGSPKLLWLMERVRQRCGIITK